MIMLPRIAQAHYDETQYIPLSEAKAGDWVFFHSTSATSDYVMHVSIVVSPAQMYKVTMI